MPGRGEVMEGAMQQAAQWGRQFMVMSVKRLLDSLPWGYESSAGKIWRQTVRKNSQRQIYLIER
jgi:hypothetical protein